jgi:glucosyl-3-phosphoglycerate phosphatase
MSARRLVLWRHGRTAWNAEHRFQGQLDVPLDPIGEAQADRAAALLADLAPTDIVCSDLVRARRTAEPLAAATGLSVAVDPLLRETNGGYWQGLTRPELAARYGDELTRWLAGADLRPGGGETRTEVADRMTLAIGRALDAQTGDGPLVVVSHGGAIRAAIGKLLGLPPQHWAALGVLSNCAWSVLQENNAPSGPPWRLLEYNAGSLPEPALGDDG